MQNFPKWSPHARSHQFTKTNISLYQDNSLEKAGKAKSQIRGALFRLREKSLLEVVTQRDLMKMRILKQKKIKELVRQNIQEYKEKKNLQHESAIKIQKCIRGYLVRKQNNERIMEFQKVKAKRCMNSMQVRIYSMWIDLKYFGKVIIKQAASVIDLAYWRYKNRKKIQMILDLYNRYLYDKKVEKLNINKYVRTLSCGSKVLAKKREELIKLKLKEINENLAILSLKKFWKANKLSSKKILTKLRKYKRFQKEKPLTRVKSFFCNDLISMHQLTYSLETMPIVYNEKILLGGYSKNQRARTVKRTVNTPSVLRKRAKAAVAHAKTPEILKRSGKQLNNPLEPKISLEHSSGTLLPKVCPVVLPGQKIETIRFYSPLAEKLGYKSFHLKIWKPISEKFRIRSSMTPTIKLSSINKIMAPLPEKFGKRPKLIRTFSKKLDT